MQHRAHCCDKKGNDTLPWTLGRILVKVSEAIHLSLLKIILL
jgi:hypothetical protein